MEYLIQDTTLTALADEVRELSGTTDKMSIDTMTDNLGDANTEVGNQADLIAQIQTALQGKASGGNGENEINLQDKTVTPTISEQVVVADAGYDGLNEVTVEAMPTATQATPSITVSTSGLITASATQSAGYVTAGTKSGTKQLTTQAAKTITPSTSSQTAVASGVYTTGVVTIGAIPSTYVKPTTTKAATTYTPTTSDQTIAAGTYCSGIQTIKGDANLIPENIVSGKTIFGVVGSAEIDSGSGGVGTIETCSGNLTFDAPPEEVTIYYVNSNMELTSLTSSSNVVFYPIKNSIIYLERWSSTGSDTGSAEQINYSQGLAVYFVSGDFTLIYA